MSKSITTPACGLFARLVPLIRLTLAATCAAALVLAFGRASDAYAQADPDTAVSFVAPVRTPVKHHEAPRDTARAATAAPDAPTPPAPVVPAPETLSDLAAWLDYKVKNQIAALPAEARLFYRRGVMAHQSGAIDEGIRLVRGASQLDPAFTLPYFTLGSWFLIREPGQALAQYASLLEVARQSFTVQLALEANAVFVAVQSLLLSLIAVGIMIVFTRSAEFRHRWRERFGRHLSPGHAAFWSWVVLIVPFTIGLGPALPTVLLLGLLWPVLKWMERTVFVMLVASLVAIPVFMGQLDRLGSPLREDREPLYGVLNLQNDALAPSTTERFATLAREHPENPFVHFGRAWVARRSNDLPTAEAAYRRTLELWPNDDRVLNNLGNVLSITGRTDEALDAYDRAAAANPFNAATHYNRARIYTDRFEFRAAADAMAKATALNFDLLKPYQSQIGAREALPPADLWIAPSRFWDALASYQPSADEAPAIPPMWRSRIEFAGWPFSFAVLLCAAIGIGFGVLQHRQMPLRWCNNCGAVVCRRCAARRREIAVCRACAAIETRSESTEFSNRMLQKRRCSVQQQTRTIRTTLAALVPGYGWVAHRRVFEAWILLALGAALAAVAFGVAAPFSYEARLASPGAPIPVLYLVVPWIALYLISLLGYLIEAERERARLAAQPSDASARGTRLVRRTSSTRAA